VHALWTILRTPSHVAILSHPPAALYTSPKHSPKLVYGSLVYRRGASKSSAHIARFTWLSTSIKISISFLSLPCPSCSDTTPPPPSRCGGRNDRKFFIFNSTRMNVSIVQPPRCTERSMLCTTLFFIISTKRCSGYSMFQPSCPDFGAEISGTPCSRVLVGRHILHYH
jgi:hypothetical protein